MDSRIESADVGVSLSEVYSIFPSHGQARKYGETHRGVVQGAREETPSSTHYLAFTASSSHLIQTTPIAAENDAVTKEVTTSSSTTSRKLKTPVITSRRAEKRKKWASIKEEVYQLYVLESKTLQETISEMEKRHSFSASLRKWKMQVKEWSFDKNLSRRGMAVQVTEREKRARETGKETVFYSRGQEISPDIFVQFKKRKLEDVVASPSAG